MSDAHDARQAVNILQAAADRARMSGADNWTTIKLERDADKALDAWREAYPDAARAERDRYSLSSMTLPGEPTNNDAQIAGER